MSPMQKTGSTSSYDFPLAQSTDEELLAKAIDASAQRLQEAATLLDKKFGAGHSSANPAHVLAAANLLATENARLTTERAMEILALMNHDLLKPVRDELTVMNRDMLKPLRDEFC